MSSASLQSTHALRSICLALILVSLLGAAWNLRHRIRAERSARAVDVVIDYADLTALANAQGAPIASALQRMRQAGATAIALPEETLLSLEAQGQVSLLSRVGWERTLKQNPISQYWDAADPVVAVLSATPEIGEPVQSGLLRAYQSGDVAIVSPTTLLVRGARDTVGKLGLGLAPAKLKLIEDAGLRVVPRLVGDEVMTSDGIAATLAHVAEMLPPARAGRPRGVIIFDGKSILGNGDLLNITQQELQRNNLVYGAVEGGKQRGDEELGTLLQGNLVRVHSIAMEELITMTQEKALQRYGLAVKDRNIRMLYVHLLPRASNDPISGAAEYVQGIVRTITTMPAMGFKVAASAPAHPFTAPPATGKWVFVLLFLGGGAAFLYWLLLLLPQAWPARMVQGGYLLLFLGVLAALGCALKLQGLGREAFGLLAAISFPLLALTWAARRIERLVAAPPLRVLGVAVGALLVATGITLLGALLVAATMVDAKLMVQVGQFSGVKAALSLPLALFALVVVADGFARPGETPAAYWLRCKANVRAFFGTPLNLGLVLLGLLVLGALGFMLLRSGNAGADTTSGGELLLRGKLDQLFFARPRTKEFLIGFPLFLFSMVAAARRRRGLALGLLLCAGIGQVDVLNTYCHAHTPVLLSLLRTANGLLLGVALGVLLLIIFAPRTVGGDKVA